MGVTQKKTLGYTERSPRKRKAYLRLRERYVRRGKEFVYIDESGFDPSVIRRYTYARKGERVYGLTSGHRRPPCWPPGSAPALPPRSCLTDRATRPSSIGGWKPNSAPF